MSKYNGCSDAIKAVCDEWDNAENAMKLAEQVSDKVIRPSVNELRYAGRRVVDALRVIEQDEAEALKLLGDAKFDCCRARHDAIDAATGLIAREMDLAITDIGPKIILKNFPKFEQLTTNLGIIRDKIRISRKDRKNRDAVYDTIQHDNLEETVALYNSFKHNKRHLASIAQADAESIRKGEFYNKFGIAINICLTLVSLAVGFLIAKYVKS